MRLFSRLPLLVFLILSTLAVRGACRPRLSTRNAATVDRIVVGHEVGLIPTQSFKDHEHAAGTHLRRRSVGFQHFLDIGQGWNVYYSSWSSIALPVQPAASALEELYASLVLRARGDWANFPPRYDVTLLYGGIRLIMHCPQRPIPWSFVGNFAEQLLHLTAAGWTGVYQVMYSHADSDISIGVHLSIVT